MTWSANFVIVYTDVANQGSTFAITETKLYFPVVTFSTEDNEKLLQQLKSGFKRIINWNKGLSKPELFVQNLNVNHLVEPSFQEVNRIFVLAFENYAQGTSNKRYYLPNVEIKDYNAMIDGKNFFDQAVKNHKIIYENIRKIATGQEDDFTSCCLLDYAYFRENYKMIAIDLSKQQALDADSRAIEQIDFTADIDRANNTIRMICWLTSWSIIKNRIIINEKFNSIISSECFNSISINSSSISSRCGIHKKI